MLSMLALAAVGLWALPQGDETVRDFKRYYRKFQDTWERVEAVRALDGIDDPAVPTVLLKYKVLQDADPQVARAGFEVLVRLPSEAARAPLRAILEEGKPPAVLPVLVRAAGAGGWQEFQPLLLPLLEFRDDSLRLWTATALGQLGAEDALPALAGLATGDPNPLVRVAAVDALKTLGKGHEEVAGPALVQALQDDALEVQTAAALALQVVREKAAVPVLLDLWEHGEGRILEQVYPTLLAITDLQFGADPALWRRWWERAGETWQVPSDEEVAKRKAARAAMNAQYVSPRQQASFMGIETPSIRVVFIIDVSGSMEEQVVDRESFQGYESYRKLDIVKEELARTIEGLEGNVRFNVLAFASKVYNWRKNLAPANALNRRSAIRWVEKLKPVGGGQAAARAAAGLRGSSGVDDGRTNTYAALLAGLGIPTDREGLPVLPADADALPTPVDTIFFLSDGRPTVGALVDPDDILESILDLNRFRRIVLHTIAIGEFQKDFMQELARRSGGQFVDLGR